MKQILAFSLFLFLLLKLSAQSKHFDVEQISFNEGLNGRVVKGTIKDQDGFLWVITHESGIHRYDGYEFQDLYDLFPDAAPLSGSLIGRTLKTNRHEILLFYVSTSGGVNKMDVFNPLTGHIQTIPLMDWWPKETVWYHVVRKSPMGAIYLYCVTAKQEMYVCQIKENFDLDLLVHCTADKLRTAIPDLKNSSFVIPGSLEPDGSFWVVHNGFSLSEINCNFQLVKTYDLKDHQKTNANQAVVSFIFEDSDHRIWLSSVFQDKIGKPIDSQISIYNLKRDAFVPHPILSKYKDIYRMVEIDKGFFLFGTREGEYYKTYLYNEYEGWVEQLEGFVIGDNDNDNNALLKESNHTYVVGMGSGILRLHLKPKPIKQYLAKNIKGHQHGVSTRGITGDSAGNVYFATEKKGWYHLNKHKENSFREIHFKNKYVDTDGRFYFPRSLFLDKEGLLWGCGRNWVDNHIEMVLVSWDPKTNSSTCYPYEYWFNNMFSVSKGIAVVAFQTGGIISLFNKETKEFTHFTDKDSTNLFSTTEVSSLVERKDGKFWVSTDRGLFLVDFYGNTAKHIETGKNRRTSLIQEPLFFIHQDKDETLWLGTDGAGLKHYDPKTGQVEVFDQTDGLCNNKVVGIVPDDDQHFWISTFNGLAYFDKVNKGFSNFYTSDGFSHNEFNRTSFYRDPQGVYYFGGMNGFNVFETKDLIDKSTPISTNISALTKWDEDTGRLQTMRTGLSSVKNLVLPAENRFLQIKVTTSDYSGHQKNQYKYFLEGFHEDWQYLRSGNEIVFNYLPAGNYILKIKGSNSRGIWSKEDIQIRIKAKEHFYKSIWFYLILLGLITGTIYGVFLQYRLGQVLKLQSMRTQISSDLHDEVGSSLTRLSMIMHTVDVDQMPDDIKSYLKKGNEILMGAISKIRDVVWAIDSKNDQTGNLVDRMMDFAFDMLRAKHIDYEFETSSINRNQILPPLIRQNIYLIYKEAIHNIVKHSNANRVWIDFQRKGEGLYLMVKNDGLRTESKKVKGSGLSNMKLRAKRMNGNLQIELEEDHFVIRLEVAY